MIEVPAVRGVPLSRRVLLAGWAVLIASGVVVGQETVTEIRVYPSVKRAIGGEVALDRARYFALCDPGTAFDQRMRPDGVVSYVLDELNAGFGRRLSPISAATGDPDRVAEDTDRPGHADLERLRTACRDRRREPSRDFASRFPEGLRVAAHGLSREYPAFLGEYATPQALKDTGKHRAYLPENVSGAAELAATALEEGYGEFDRPAFFEPINEPHWSFIGDQHLADWHLRVQQAVRNRDLPVLVGGPCLPVAYFYREGYRAFRGFREFLKNTSGSLDFYSFHVYDYVNWDGEGLTGRVTSGLPLEGVLDLVQAHAFHEYGDEIALVVSEHGGYISGSRGRLGPDEVGAILAGKAAGNEDDFAGVLRQRSVSSHVLVSAAIANTLTFVEHPHVLKKAVPFILPESMAWDPRYYSTLYVPDGFTDRSQWIETRNSDFYKFFFDLRGDRVYLRNKDPDIQARAFIDGEMLRVVLNNLSDAPHAVQLVAPAPLSASIRRYGRGEDYTPYLTEGSCDPGESIELAGREAAVVSFAYDRPVPERRTVDETPYYGRSTSGKDAESSPRRFVVEVPERAEVRYASLRVSVTRPSGSSPDVRIRVNGKRVDTPSEESANRYDDGEREYASTKLVAIDPSWLRERNRVDVTFPDGEPGSVGSVVIRIGRTLL